MTVRRDSFDYFNASPPSVANAVRAVLARRPPYTQVAEIKKDTFFKANVRPSWWLLRTDMIIQVHTSSGGTEVITRMQSHRLILRDVFDRHNRYIRDFLEALQTEIQKQREQLPL
jgi:hypothetical protein